MTGHELIASLSQFAPNTPVVVQGADVYHRYAYPILISHLELL